MTMAPQRALRGLVGGNLSGLAFESFRDGVEICRLATGVGGSALALLRYAAGAAVPLHLHPDVETIVVVSGTQSDDQGTYRAGDVVVNLPGSTHRVWSDDGCVVLISWAAPVRILDEQARP